MQSPDTRRDGALFSAAGRASAPAQAALPEVSRSATTIAMGLLALAAVILGRALTRALPGSTTGIGKFLRVVDVAAAVATQLFVLVGLSAAVTLLVGTLWHRRLNYAYRLVALPAGSAVVLLVAIATQHRLQPAELTIMGAAAIALATAASLVVVRSTETRAAGIVLWCATMASTCYLLSRVLLPGLWEARRDLVAQVARVLATGGFALDLATMGVTMAWLAARRVRTFVIVFGSIAAFATLATWGAIMGSHPGATFWQVLAARALNALTPYPAPLVTVAGRYWSECFALVFSAVVFLSPTRAPVLQLSVGLAVLARATVDVPVSALLLALSALLAPMVTSPGGAPGMWKSWEQKNAPATARDG